jgi:GlpG protein
MRVIETTLEENLALFSRYLWQERLAHRIFEERGRQILEVRDDVSAERVRSAYDAWRAGEFVLEESQPPAIQDDVLSTSATGPKNSAAQILREHPGLAVLILLALAVFPFSWPIADNELTLVARWLTIVDLTRNEPMFWYTALFTGEIWRWLTPIFLHFSVLHIAFNCVVVFELGRRIENVNGTLWFCVLVLVLGVVSNLGQFVLNPAPLFGGLSGVGYGFLGYLLVCQKRFPDEPRWQMPPGFAISLLIFLVVFTTGVTEAFGLHVANAAHWFGLLSGVTMAYLAPVRKPV